MCPASAARSLLAEVAGAPTSREPWLDGRTPTEVDPDTVTMYSQLLLADAADGSRRTLTICYPGDAEPDQGFISVLSPLVASLLGMRVGDVTT